MLDNKTSIRESFGSVNLSQSIDLRSLNIEPAKEALNSNHEFVTIDEENKSTDVHEKEVKLEIKENVGEKTNLNFLFRYIYK